MRLLRYARNDQWVVAPEEGESNTVQGSKQGYVYIMTNKGNTSLYTGVTNDLVRRVREHKEKLFDGFTKKYNITKLIYYEAFDDIVDAIYREKQIKAGSRQNKIDLINGMNPQREDLSGKWY